MLRSIEIKPWFLRFVLYEHFSSSLSCPRNLWVTEVEEPQNRPRVYWGTEVSCAKLILGNGSALREFILGNGSALRENILGNGSALREIILGNGSAVPKLSWGTEVHCAKLSWGTEVQYRNYPGERKTTATEISWGTEDDRDSPPPLLSRQVPPADGVLRSSAPQSDFHSHHP